MNCFPESDEHTLYLIPFSHYCEAARWCLKLKGVKVKEAAFPPGCHMFFGPMAKIRKQSGKTSTARETSLPLLVSPAGVVVADDSWECCEMLGPIEADTKKLLDEVVGPCTRTITYSYFLTPEGDPHYLKLATAGDVPWYCSFLLGLGPFRAKVSEIMHEGMVKNPEFVEESRQKLRDAMTQLTPKLKTEFAFKDTPTAPAIALMCLFAPVVMPPEYCRSFYGEYPVPLESLPANYQKEINEWRATELGQWVLDNYAKHGLKKGD